MTLLNLDSNLNLGGGFKYLFFLPVPGEIVQFD